MTTQTVELAGKKFVIVEQRAFLRLQQKAEVIARQNAGDVAESKRRLAESGASIPWERIKARRTKRANRRAR